MSHMPRPSVLSSSATLAAIALAVWSSEVRADGPVDPILCGPAHTYDAAAGDQAGRLRATPISMDGGTAAAIPAWKTIALGTPGGVPALRAALNGGCRVGGLAREILARPAFTAGTRPRTIELVVLSAAELSFEGEGAPRAAIYERAAQLGLTLCPAEVGPQLRLQYRDQPAGEFLHVAMRPIPARRAPQAAFVVANGGSGPLLIAEDASPERIVPPHLRFVFVRPR